MKIIDKESGYRMIVSGNIPVLTKTYIRKHVIDKAVWSELFTGNAQQQLKKNIQRHLDGLGANVVQQLMNKLTVDEKLIAYCKKKYKQY